MQDLLNEKEFAPKYDPWKSFYRFYGIALLQLPLLIGLSEIFKRLLHEFVFIFSGFALVAPIVTACLMFAYKKENGKVGFRTMFYAISGLLLTYYIPVLALVLIFSDDAIASAFVMGLFVFHLFATVIAVIVVKEVLLPLRDRKNKR